MPIVRWRPCLTDTEQPIFVPTQYEETASLNSKELDTTRQEINPATENLETTGPPCKFLSVHFRGVVRGIASEQVLHVTDGT